MVRCACVDRVVRRGLDICISAVPALDSGAREVANGKGEPDPVGIEERGINHVPCGAALPRGVRVGLVIPE